jgi:hypothetical protein
MPGAARLPDELHGWGLSVALVLLLSTCLVADAVALSVAAVVLALWKPAWMYRPVNIGAPYVLSPWSISPLEWLPQLVLVPTVIVFCLWMYRSYRNLQDMGVVGLGYSPRWAAGSVFVPIVNLFLPYLITQEMWKASDPDTRGALEWRDSRGSSVVSVWWALEVTSGIAFQVWLVTAVGSENDMETDVARGIGIAANLMSILAALCAIGVVLRLHARQARKLEALRSSERKAVLLSFRRPGQ